MYFGTSNSRNSQSAVAGREIDEGVASLTNRKATRSKRHPSLLFKSFIDLEIETCYLRQQYAKSSPGTLVCCMVDFISN
jgi:hypothetical protein